MCHCVKTIRYLTCVPARRLPVILPILHEVVVVTGLLGGNTTSWVENEHRLKAKLV